MNPKKTDSVFDEATGNFDFHAIFEKIGTQQMHRCECDDADGVLTVGASLDGDMWLALYEHPRQLSMLPGFRARTWQGGGRKERVRKALMLLALAVVEDAKPKT